MFGANHPIVGFYHVPPIWVGEAPRDAHGLIDPKRVNERVFNTTLRSGIGVSVHRCGVFFFDFSTYPPPGLPPNVDRTDPNAVYNANKALANRRVTLMDAYLTCVYQAYDRRPTFPFWKMVISPSSLIKRDSLAGSRLSVNDTRLIDILSGPEHVSWDEATRRAQTITLDVLKESLDLFSDLLEHGYAEAPLLVALFLRSCVSYEDDNYSVALLMAWAVIEKLLNRMWDRYLSVTPEQHVRSLSQKNNWSMRNYPEVVAAAMIDVLNREGLFAINRHGFIIDDLESHLTIARNARNAWIHDLATIGRQDAARAKHAVEEMLGLSEGIHFNLAIMENIVY